MVIDEPVRGSVPPPWFGALSGIERMRAFSNGLLPLPPLFRLFGIRPAHVGPGSATWTMPASAWLQGGTGALEISTFIESALTGTAVTALPGGAELVPITVSTNYFRPSRPQPGNLLARARVVNASSFFAFTEVEVEDPQGRRIAHATSQSAIRQIEPPPPPPPATLRPVEEPVYETPDPPARPVAGDLPPLEVWEEKGGLEALRMIHGRSSSYSILTGLRTVELDAGRFVATLPASEWFCRFSRCIAPGIVAFLANSGSWVAGLSLLGPGRSYAALDSNVRLYRSLLADGRALRTEVLSELRGGDIAEAQMRVYDAGGALVGAGSAVGVLIDTSRRRSRPKREAKRMLASLLFTDIVGSTDHVARLGDARWRALLAEHHTAVRSEIARCEGIEVDTAGDGFLVRFESPARALECARAVRNAVKRLGIEMRAGVHTGECEILGRSITGMAVHIASRIQAAAAPGEILASGTVKDLAVGSDLRFEDRGQHTLKGVPEEWRLYSLAK